MDRKKKLEVDLKRELGFILNNHIKDPRLGFVTITGINLSTDFKYLDIYISVMGNQEKVDQSMRVLEWSSGFIKRKLNERIDLRTTPVLRFQYDESIDKGMRITEILDRLKKDNEL